MTVMLTMGRQQQPQGFGVGGVDRVNAVYLVREIIDRE